MLTTDQIDIAARSLAHGRLSLEPIELPEAMRPADESDAYILQAEVNRRLTESRLGVAVGHKIGCTTPVMQAYLGISSPCAGDVFAATTFHSPADVSAVGYRRLGVECEIAVRISRDILPEEAPFTRERMASTVEAVMAGIEIVDDRYRDYRALGAPTLIADNFFNAGCVLGEPVTNWGRLDLVGLEGRLLINGREVGRGYGGMILGHPFEALAWLANSRAARGLGIRKGAFVFLGSLVETKWLGRGDTMRVEIESLGALDLAMSP